MAVKMIYFWISLVLAIIGTNAAGQLSILHHPESISFKGSEKLRESMLKEAFCAALGLSTEPHSEWDGLYIVNPFDTPEAAVEVYVDGVEDLGDFGDKAKAYPLLVDLYEPDTFSVVKDRIRLRSSGTNHKLVDVKLSDNYDIKNYAGVFGELSDPKVTKQSLQYLKQAVEEDFQFLSELQAMKDITAALKTNTLKSDNEIDFFNFRFSSLHVLSDYHGSDSLATKEAKKLLNQAIRELKDGFVKIYDGRILFVVVSTDVAHTRRYARDVAGDDDMKDAKDSVDYPVIFNIILWFCIVLSFAMIAVVYAIMDMDPGRDSIIYRMTSTRMKKDN